MNTASFEQKLVLTSAAEAAFRRLWTLISQGEYAPGSLHTEEQLAAALAISRTPLREAARRLEDLGLLEREPSRGLRVTRLSMHEMLELSTAREAIEALLIADACRRIARGDGDLRRLEQIHQRLKRIVTVGDAELALSVGIEFHEEIKHLSGNRTAARFYDHLLLAFERYRLLAAQSSERPELMHAEHDGILVALRAGDRCTAEARMREHLRQARELYAAVLSSRLGDL